MIYIELVYSVQILYKSGQSVTQEYIEFKYNRNGNGDITEVNYKTATPFKKPLFVNIDQIEAIYQTNTRFRLRFGRRR